MIKYGNIQTHIQNEKKKFNIIFHIVQTYCRDGMNEKRRKEVP